jgi:hypothetical protein
MDVQGSSSCFLRALRAARDVLATQSHTEAVLPRSVPRPSTDRPRLEPGTRPSSVHAAPPCGMPTADTLAAPSAMLSQPTGRHQSPQDHSDPRRSHTCPLSTALEHSCGSHTRSGRHVTSSKPPPEPVGRLSRCPAIAFLGQDPSATRGQRTEASARWFHQGLRMPLSGFCVHTPVLEDPGAAQLKHETGA